MKHIIISLCALAAVAGATAQNVFARNTLPQVPSELEFAGERVPLENYDTRESLQREMIVTYYMHGSTFRALLNSRRYFSIIEPILDRNGVPDDFKYLCMAESGLNPNAVSSAKAAGLWQFMPATGKSYGMEVGTQVDERFDIEKSTEAACKYLKEAYRRFGSWTVAAASYNLGAGGVSKRMETQGVTDYYDAFFPEETMRYMFRILSFKLLCEDPYHYGFMLTKQDLYPPLTDYTVIEVRDATIDWSKLAARHGTTYKMLRELNPWIRDYEFTNKTGKTWKVKIPSSTYRAEPEKK